MVEENLLVLKPLYNRMKVFC